MTTIIICYPTPTGDDAYSPAFHKKILETVRPGGIRFNFHHRDTERARLILDTQGDSYTLPIVDADYDSPDLRATAEWTTELTRLLVGRNADRIEVMNEPFTAPNRYHPGTRRPLRMDPFKYADVVQVVRQATDMPLAIAGDFVRPGGWFHRDWMRWWQRVRSRLTAGEDYQYVAVHPYRGHAPHLSSTYWPNIVHRNRRLLGRFFPLRPRLAEWARLRDVAGAPLVHTECGWDQSTPEVQADYIRGEIAEARLQGVETVTFYAHATMLDPVSLEITPQGRAIREASEAVK